MVSDQTILLLLDDILPSGISLFAFSAGMGVVLFILFVLLISCAIRNHFISGQLLELRAEKAHLTTELQSLRDRLTGREVQLTQLSTTLENERSSHNEKLQLLETAREELRLQFAELAAEIFDEKGNRFTEMNQNQLSGILQPFGERLTSLKSEINDIYRQESRERISLQQQIAQLRDASLQMNREAANLTRALKGDSKLQGDWGEVVLERILERSGLRPGVEYDIQSSFRDRSNSLKRPDVIVHLPHERDIIIDSKVSLVNWEKSLNSDDPKQQKQFIRQLVDDIRRHIQGLADKQYPELPGLRSLDFVLLFIPIEPVFHTVFNAAPELADHAAERNIVVVSPTTLTATLKTISHIWRTNQQNQNVLEIARRAGIMHDKFLSFAEEMEKIGRQLGTCRTTYDVALKKLATGRNNLVSQSKRIRELGVRTSRDLPDTIRRLTETEDE